MNPAISYLMSNIKRFIYLVVLFGFSAATAGSYDDFFLAIKRDDSGTIINLLTRGFDPNTLNPAGEPGLLLAVKEPSIKVAEVLINWPKTDVELRNKQDESPLMMAAFKGLLEISQKLIARDADVNKTGWTPLHYAATHGHLQIIALLLDKHAYIDAESPNGSTPLMMAAHYGTPEAVKLLLESGADPLLKNQQGLSAIDFAQQAKRQDIAEIVAAAIRARKPKGTW
jgi:ankyrin repeat protein